MSDKAKVKDPKLFWAVCIIILIVYFVSVPLFAIRFGRWFILVYILVGGPLWGFIPDAIYQRIYDDKKMNPVNEE